MDTFFQDLNYGIRMLTKNPAFAIVAVLTLALGIGANTAVFSLVDAVLLRPLPFPEPQRLVAVGLSEPKTDTGGAFGNMDFIAWRDQQHSFTHVAAYAGDGSSFSFNAGGEPQRVRGISVTAGFFDMLGVAPERGRTFQPQDDRPEAPPVVVISHEFWQAQLSSDPQVVGRSIMLNGRAFTVIGVMRAGLRFPSNRPVDVWPLRVIATPRGRPPYYLVAMGRLKPGATMQQAQDELTAVSRAVEQQFPNTPLKVGRVEPLREVLTRDVSGLLWVLLAAVGFVLLIGIVNVANLLLARATAREKEIGIRLALGATRARIVRQLMTESVLLASIGGGLGVLLAVWAQHAFLRLTSVRIPLSYQVGLDRRVLLFTLAVSVLSGVLFGLAPAFHGRGGALHEALKDAARTTSSAAGQTTRRGLVASEFALALVLMAGAALMIRSFVRLQHVNPGFDTRNLLTAQITLPPALYRDEPAIAAFWDQLLRRINTLPGVESASLTLSLPPHLLVLTNPFTVEGQPYDRSRPLQLAEEMTISSGHFRTLGVPLLAGRDFQDADRTSGRQEAIIINRALAEKFFPGQDPVGKRLQTGDPDPSSPWEPIVGVVGDVKYSGLEATPTPQLYKLYTTQGWTGFSRAMYVVIRTKGDPLSVAPAVRAQLNSLDRNLPLGSVATMQQLLGDAVEQPRFRTVVFGSFAGFALLLACFGVYAVMSYTVGQRTREIGIRIALGANRGQIVRLVLGQALAVCAVGMAVGMVAATLLAGTLRSQLYGVSPGDPVSLAAATLLLAAVALLASYIPARRATRVDPMVALRYE
jgi:putative ABC transport system permease protein